MMHGWGYGSEMPIGGMWFGGIFWLLMIIAIVALAVYLVQRFTYRQQTSRGALDHLEQAYARGEIKREEFLQKRADLAG